MKNLNAIEGITPEVETKVEAIPSGNGGNYISAEVKTIVSGVEQSALRTPRFDRHLNITIHPANPAYDTLPTLDIEVSTWVWLNGIGGESVYDRQQLLHYQDFTLTELRTLATALNQFLAEQDKTPLE